MLVLDSASVLRQTRRKSTAPANPLPTTKSAVLESGASLAMASSLPSPAAFAVDVERGLAGGAVDFGEQVMPFAVVDFDRGGGDRLGAAGLEGQAGAAVGADGQLVSGLRPALRRERRWCGRRSVLKTIFDEEVVGAHVEGFALRAVVGDLGAILGAGILHVLGHLGMGERGDAALAVEGERAFDPILQRPGDIVLRRCRRRRSGHCAG